MSQGVDQRTGIFNMHIPVVVNHVCQGYAFAVFAVGDNTDVIQVEKLLQFSVDIHPLRRWLCNNIVRCVGRDHNHISAGDLLAEAIRNKSTCAANANDDFVTMVTMGHSGCIGLADHKIHMRTSLFTSI
jgi:hypothetical protein